MGSLEPTLGVMASKGLRNDAEMCHVEQRSTVRGIQRLERNNLPFRGT